MCIRKRSPKTGCHTRHRLTTNHLQCIACAQRTHWRHEINRLKKPKTHTHKCWTNVKRIMYRFCVCVRPLCSRQPKTIHFKTYHLNLQRKKIFFLQNAVKINFNRFWAYVNIEWKKSIYTMRYHSSVCLNVWDITFRYR